MSSPVSRIVEEDAGSNQFRLGKTMQSSYKAEGLLLGKERFVCQLSPRGFTSQSIPPSWDFWKPQKGIQLATRFNRGFLKARAPSDRPVLRGPHYVELTTNPEISRILRRFSIKLINPSPEFSPPGVPKPRTPGSLSPTRHQSFDPKPSSRTFSCG